MDRQDIRFPAFTRDVPKTAVSVSMHSPHLIHVTVNPQEKSFPPIWGKATIPDLGPVRLNEEREAHNRDLLQSFLYPIDVDDFLNNHYRRGHAIAITHTSPGDGAARVLPLIEQHFCGLRLKELLEQTASDSIFVWSRTVQPSDEQTDDSNPKNANVQIESFSTDDPNIARICHGSGSSLYFRSSQIAADSIVPFIAEAVGMDFAARDHTTNNQLHGEIETFVSRGGHFTDWHFDYMENFTVQLRGEKTWCLHRSPIQHPVRGYTPHYRESGNLQQQTKLHCSCDPTFHFDRGVVHDNCVRVTLRPGDVLYHPAGVYHRVECDADSISINVSLVSILNADIVSSCVRQIFWNSLQGRAFMNARNPNQTRDTYSHLLNKGAAMLQLLANYPQFVLCDAVFLKQPKSGSLQNIKDREGKRKRVCASDEMEYKSVEFWRDSRFLINPLCVLVRADHLPLDERPHRDSGDDEQMDEETEEDEEEMEDEDGKEEGKGEMEEDEETEDLIDVEDHVASGIDEEMEHQDAEPVRTYVLHSNFGDETISSMVKQVFNVSSWGWPLMEGVRTRFAGASCEIARGVEWRDVEGWRKTSAGAEFGVCVVEGCVLLQLAGSNQAVEDVGTIKRPHHQGTDSAVKEEEDAEESDNAKRFGLLSSLIGFGILAPWNPSNK